MAKKGIETRTFFFPLHRQPCFKPILKTLPRFGVNEPILLTTPNNRYFNPRPVVGRVNRITNTSTVNTSNNSISAPSNNEILNNLRG